MSMLLLIFQTFMHEHFPLKNHLIMGLYYIKFLPAIPHDIADPS